MDKARVHMGVLVPVIRMIAIIFIGYSILRKLYMERYSCAIGSNEEALEES